MYVGTDYRVAVINANGTGVMDVPPGMPPPTDMSPAWSPTGAKFAFASDRSGNLTSANIWTMNTNGTGLVNLTPDARDPGRVAGVVTRRDQDCIQQG